MMNLGKQRKTVIASMCVIVGMTMMGCGAVKVSLSNYHPVLTEDRSAYEGKPAGSRVS